MVQTGKLVLSYNYNEEINTVYFIYESVEDKTEKFVIPFSLNE